MSSTVQSLVTKSMKINKKFSETWFPGFVSRNKKNYSHFYCQNIYLFVNTVGNNNNNFKRYFKPKFFK